MDPFELIRRPNGRRLCLCASNASAWRVSFPACQGQHLVIVFYDPRDIPGEEWIANKPDPRSAKIIWARDMGAVKNEELPGPIRGASVWFAYRNQPWRPLVPASAGALPDPVGAAARPD